MDQLIAWLKAHGVNVGLLGALVLRHFWGNIVSWWVANWQKTEDALVMKALVEFNGFLKSHGATDEEIKNITMNVAQVALRLGQDIQKANAEVRPPKAP